ncbi:MAG TPA: hypothetical protein VGH30_08515 [Jatrophihabitantaceae bacterium]|jgi:hypothetical protein
MLRAIAGAQAAVGTALAARPDAATRMAGIKSPDAPPAWLVRVLGVRMAAQAGLELLAPSTDVALLGAGVDVTHAASMFAVAAVSRRYRRGAVVSGAIASGFALALLAARGGVAARYEVT